MPRWHLGAVPRLGAWRGRGGEEGEREQARGAREVAAREELHVQAAHRTGRGASGLQRREGLLPRGGEDVRGLQGLGRHGGIVRQAEARLS